MATNALAPKPQNALTRQADPMQALLRQSAEYPQYGELVDYLSARRMMPPIQQKYGSSSSFVTPGFYSGPDSPPVTGIVKIAKGETPNAVVHELTHAAQRQIQLQYLSLQDKARKAKLTPLDEQFIQTYEKLIYRPGELIGARPERTQSLTAKRIAPEWTNKESDYRATGDELAAWGMGSTVNRNADSPAPLHIDPSYATEFSILLDMARKLQKSQPVTDKR
jgi:hypothetical protein